MNVRCKPIADDSGVGSVFAVALLALLCFVAVVAVGISGIVLTHRRAQSAADLAALAGANAVQLGGQACDAARAIARSNRAELVTCIVAAQSISVQVHVDAPPGLARFDLGTTARARAGPVE